MSDSSESKKRRRRLTDIMVDWVSLVDHPANLRPFLLIKHLNGNGDTNMKDNEKVIVDGIELDAESLEYWDENILKALDPNAANAITAFVARIQKHVDGLPDGMATAVELLKSAAGGEALTKVAKNDDNPPNDGGDGLSAGEKAILDRMDAQDARITEIEKATGAYDPEIKLSEVQPMIDSAIQQALGEKTE